MKILLCVLIASTALVTDFTLDFGKNSDATQWRVVNDGVMGGRSSSEIELRESSMYFTGRVSLENNGGFASVRSPYQNFDLSSYKTVKLRVRGTARKFAFTLDTHRAWYKPNYKFEFTPSPDRWEEFSVPLEALKESRIGEFTGNTLRSDQLSEVIQMGIILYDKKAGPFELEIDRIIFEE